MVQKVFQTHIIQLLRFLASFCKPLVRFEPNPLRWTPLGPPMTYLNNASYLYCPHLTDRLGVLRVHFIILQRQDILLETALINVTLVKGIVMLM